MRSRLYGIAAAPGIARPSTYRSGPPIPAGEIALALIVIAALVGFGIAFAVLWNRYGPD